jgi:hypothetical protein
MVDSSSQDGKELTENHFHPISPGMQLKIRLLTDRQTPNRGIVP